MAINNQKLKLLYLVKIFTEDTDDQHALTLPQIVDKLHAYGVNAERKTLVSQVHHGQEIQCADPETGGHGQQV